MHALDRALGILRSTPDVLRALLGGLNDDLIRANHGPGTFSPFDVIGHLILGERLDWLPRTRVILDHGEARPFDPFPWDGRDEETAHLSPPERLDVLTRLRAQNLADLDAMHLTDDDLQRTGAHPKFGRVTLGQMLNVWAVHDLHHVAQICKAVNYQFRHAIGPWRPHLNSIPPERG